MITIATVLRSGGEYLPEHVAALRDQCAQFAPAHRFVCLTDLHGRLDCETIALDHDWPGWWAKMEVFKVPGPVLYFDLDTVIVRDISPIIELAGDDHFVILRDFYRGRINRHAMQSSMMWWNGDVSHLYREFAAEPRFYMGGDQEWLEQHYAGEFAFWQDVAPRCVGSWKASERTKNERVIIFHGKPRPWEVDLAAA
jgi:hypothetical protein